MSKLASFGLALWCGLALAAHGATVPPAEGATNAAARPPAPRRPNILFILTDDLGYADLGCYGQSKVQTPNLDRLAAEGMRFTSFYGGAAVGDASRCALVTGRHSGHASIRGCGKGALSSDEQTLAEMLQQTGYHTGLVGEWGLGNETSGSVPQKKGFKEFIGYLDAAHAQDYYAQYLWRFDPGSAFDGKRPIFENQGGLQVRYIPEVLTTAAWNFIRFKKPDKVNHHRPFFLLLSYTVPRPNLDEVARAGHGIQVPNQGVYGDQPWPDAEKSKAAMLSLLDTYIGALLDQLKQLQLERDTVVFFASGNGPRKEGGVDPKFLQSTGPFRGGKPDLYEGGIRVPFIVRWPAQVRAGQVCDVPAALWDVLPTAAEIARAKPPEGLDGISLLPTLHGQPQTNQHPFLYWESHEGGFQQAVRMAEWKAVLPQPGKPLELYNLKADPGEKQDLAGQNPDVTAKIEEYLKTARSDSAQWPIRPAPAQVEQPKQAASSGR
jgi:arylsulfatase A-like enzyme